MTDPTTAARDALLADAKRAIDAPDVFWTLMGRSIDALIATVEAKRSAEVAALVEARWRYDHPNGIKACSDCKACGGAWDEHDPDGGECPVQWVLAALAQTQPTDAGRLECLCHCHHDGGPCDRRECSRNFRPAPAPVTEPVSRTNGKVREHDFCCYYQHEFGQSCLLPDPFVLTVTYGPDTAPTPVTEDALAAALHRAEIDCWPDVDGCAASGHRGAAYRLRAAIPAPEPSSGAVPVSVEVVPTWLREMLQSIHAACSLSLDDPDEWPNALRDIRGWCAEALAALPCPEEPRVERSARHLNHKTPGPHRMDAAQRHIACGCCPCFTTQEAR